MMKQILSVLLLALSAQNVLGFTGPNSPIRNTPLAQEATDLASKHIASAAGFVTGAVGVIGQVVAADEYELAELPPPYVPAIFGLVLLVGVGVLTSSLGNVMDEEAGLGMQSGARAKKEIERSRSSYFGKRPK